MNIHLVQNSLSATFSKSQKSHYARTRCNLLLFEDGLTSLWSVPRHIEVVMLELLNSEKAMFITTLVIIGHTSAIINLYIKRRAWLGLKTIDPSLIYSSLIYAKDKSETRMYFFKKYFKVSVGEGQMLGKWKCSAILMQLRCRWGADAVQVRCSEVAV